MELNVFERLILLNILPREGGLTTLKIVRDLQAALSFSEDEHKDLRFQYNGTQIRWELTADRPKDIKIGEEATRIIIETFAALDREEKLRIEYLPFYERLTGGSKEKN